MRKKRRYKQYETENMGNKLRKRNKKDETRKKIEKDGKNEREEIVNQNLKGNEKNNHKKSRQEKEKRHAGKKKTERRWKINQVGYKPELVQKKTESVNISVKEKERKWRM